MYLKIVFSSVFRGIFFLSLDFFVIASYFSRKIQYVEIVKRSISNFNSMFKDEKHLLSPTKHPPLPL